MNQTTIEPIVPSTLDNETRWQATEERNARFDGQFLYAVRSTGIYCRPSCPSRRPRREQVEFFDACDDAEAAGFRPCRRCRPRDVAREIALTDAACRYIDAHLDEPLTLARLGEVCGFSPYHLQRTFKRVVGLTPRQYIDERRIGRLKARLRDGSDVTTALYDAGYGSSSRIYENGSARLGMTPKTYGQGGAGVTIDAAIVDTPLGRLLVATTARGVCAVYLGDEDEELLSMLRTEYPAADIRTGQPATNDWIDAVAALIDGQEIPVDLSLDVRATSFQQRVWAFLRTIPRGETRSYGEVAAGIAQPTAARAVAQACARNPVALIVPCHRVVRGDGAPGGYRWGAARKQALLERERG